MLIQIYLLQISQDFFKTTSNPRVKINQKSLLAAKAARGGTDYENLRIGEHAREDV